MSIEVRNLKPKDQSFNISPYTNVEFDLVSVGSSLIDISSLSVVFTMYSNIDGNEYDLVYSVTDTNVISYQGSEIFYHVIVNPDRPFDEGSSITLSINVNDSLNVAMTEYVSTFGIYYVDIISDFKYAFINNAQEIPVYNEILMKDSTSSPKEFDSAYKNWNMKPKPRIQVNEVIVEDGYTINYEEGKIVFDSSLDYNDQVEATYTFSFFSDEQINSYFKQATAVWQRNPPFGGVTTIYRADSMMQSVLMVGAATYAFRDLMFNLAFQEKRVIFDNHSWEDGWKQINNLFKDLYDSYRNDWEKLLEAKKLRLPEIASVVTPEYTLPGGRSRYFRYLYKSGSSGL